MAEVLTVLYSNPFLTWLLAWGLWPVCWMLTNVLTAPFAYAFRAYNRKKRSANISSQGWPTNPNMDADGDIILPQVEED